MLAQTTIDALAAELHDAEKRRVQLRHFSKRHPEMTIADGYAIQRAWLALKLAEGRVVKGRKIGLTSRAMQQASQIT
ncbi:MAG: 2-oxo-hept-4-ene-1,7-dioate hydratase, partial [Caldimonas sp.]